MTHLADVIEGEAIRPDLEAVRTSGIVRVDPAIVAGHLAELVEKVTDDLQTKYLNGQREHGGHLHRKPGLLQHAKDEALDQVAYLYSLERQLLEATDFLRLALTRHDWRSAEKAYRILIHGNAEGEIYRKGDA